VNAVVQIIVSVVVGGVVAVLGTVSLVSTQTAAPEPTSTDVITYDR
jgi:hypothetical protein